DPFDEVPGGLFVLHDVVVNTLYIALDGNGHDLQGGIVPQGGGDQKELAHHKGRSYRFLFFFFHGLNLVFSLYPYKPYPTFRTLSQSHQGRHDRDRALPKPPIALPPIAISPFPPVGAPGPSAKGRHNFEGPWHKYGQNP